jgi:hypothetical protein
MDGRDINEDEKKTPLPNGGSSAIAAEDAAESLARATERELFQRLARVKQYPISWDDEPAPDPKEI